MRKPEHKLRPGETRQSAWDEIQKRKDGTFTVHDIWYGTRMARASVKQYMTGLEIAGYLEVIGKEPNNSGSRGRNTQVYRLINDVGREAPRVNRDGSAVTGGLAQEHMWRAMRIIKEFSVKELAINASTEQVQVSERNAKKYTLYLHKAGYLQRKRNGHDVRYRFIESRYPGPRPPVIQSELQVFDPNSKTVVWSQYGGAA